MPTFNNMNDLMKSIQKRIDATNGEYSLDEIFNNGFIQQHSRYNSINEMFEDNKMVVQDMQEFDDIPNHVKDKMVYENTDFKSWGEFIDTAKKEFVVKKLREQGLNVR